MITELSARHYILVVEYLMRRVRQAPQVADLGATPGAYLRFHDSDVT